MLRRVGIVAAIAILPCVPVIAAAAQAEQLSRQTIPDVQRLGPQVGTRVPDFSLTDQNGRLQTLRSIMGANGAMLVFFRSADW